MQQAFLTCYAWYVTALDTLCKHCIREAKDIETVCVSVV